MSAPTHKRDSGTRLKLEPLEAPAIPQERVAEKRDALLCRLAQLPARVKHQRGYRTATALLGKKFLAAGQATQIALLQAASFMADVLEKLPPPPT